MHTFHSSYGAIASSRDISSFRASSRLLGGILAPAVFAFCQSVYAQQPQIGTATGRASAATSVSPALATFQAEQKALADSYQQLLSQNPTPQQITAWHQQHDADINAQKQRAQAIAAAMPKQPLPVTTAVNVPPGASQTLKDFLNTRADLMNKRAALYNQQLRASGTVDAVNIEASYRQQNAGEIAAQQQRIRLLAQAASSQPIPAPPPLQIPGNASPQLAAFLRARDQLMRDRITVLNQNVSATPQVRAAALAAWEKQNQGRLGQLRQAAQAQASAQTSNQ